MYKKILKVILAVVGILALVFVGLAIYNYHRIQTGELVQYGGRWITRADLEKVVPPQYYDAPALNTPEEVYTKFREALLEGDKESALSYITEKKRAEYREAFGDEKLFQKYTQIPEVFNIVRMEKESIGNHAHYFYGEKETRYEVFFEKNRAGYWEISGI